MIIKKRVRGHIIELDYRPVKTFKNKIYTLYDVYLKDKFLYRTCLDFVQLRDIRQAGYKIECEEADE